MSNSEDKHNAFHFPNNINLDAEENIYFLDDLICKKFIDLVIITIPTPQVYFLLNSLKNRPKVITIVHASILEYLPHFSKMFKFEFNNLAEIPQLIIRGIRLPFLYIIFRKKLKIKYELIYKHSTKIIVLSEKYKRDMLSFNKDYNPKKIVSIENINPFYPHSLDFKKENQVLFVGRLTYIKRVDQILKAWNLINSQRGNWVLKIIGDGDEKNTLENFVLRNNINNVSFEGKINPLLEYKVSSIICLTSIYEGMPMVLLEALQFGVVPIVYDTFGAASDIIKNGYNGFLIKPFDYRSRGENISFLINNPYELQKMSKNALESSKLFDISSVGYKWIDLFKNLN